MRDLSELNSQSFLANLDSNFQAQTGDSDGVALRLAQVNESAMPSNIESFSLYFVGPRSQPLAQRIYHLEHEKMGGIDLFLTAVAADSNGITYEAAFHRLRKKP